MPVGHHRPLGHKIHYKCLQDPHEKCITILRYSNKNPLDLLSQFCDTRNVVLIKQKASKIRSINSSPAGSLLSCGESSSTVEHPIGSRRTTGSSPAARPNFLTRQELVAPVGLLIRTACAVGSSQTNYTAFLCGLQ